MAEMESVMENTDAVPLRELGFFTSVRFFIGLLFKGAVLYSCFLALSLLKYNFCEPGNQDSYLYFAGGIVCVCAAYFIFYIFTEGIFKQALIGFIISIIGFAIVAIFPPFGIVIAIIGIISMINSIISFVKMIPLLLLGALICLLLFSSEILNYLLNSQNIDFLLVPVFSIVLPFPDNETSNFVFALHKCDVPYYILSLLVSINLSFKYSLKNALFRMSIIFLSIPIMLIIYYIVKSKIQRSVMQPQGIQQADVQGGRIYVKPYQRANGTLVSGYWRKT